MALLATENGARAALVASLLFGIILLRRASGADRTGVGGAGSVIVVFVFVDPVVVSGFIAV